MRDSGRLGWPAICWASLVLSACASGEPDTGEPSLVNQGLVSAGARAGSLQGCVDAHLADRGGNPAAVQELNCPLATPEPCDAPPDLSSIVALRNLRQLDLSGRCVADARPIGTLTKLERLRLAGTYLTDIRPLGSLTELRALDLSRNAIEDTWKFKTHEPFSRWQKLESLNLDEALTRENILPLGVLVSLRSLSLRNNYLWSVRPLLGLHNLRTLHIDGNSIEDVAPLAALHRLEELTLNRNFVTSVEPLRSLSANEGGRLRRVSLVENCTASCDALSGIEHDCSDQFTECESIVRNAPGYALSVPVELVERYAPPELPVWSQGQLQSGFQLIKTLPIAWESARSGCNDRSDQAIWGLQEAGYPGLTAVLAYGNVRPLTVNDPAGFLAFDWHIAPAARVLLDSGETAHFVLDPALDPSRPLRLREWYQRLVDSAGSDLNFSCVDYYAAQPEVSNPADHCTPDVNIAIDARGNLSVDPLSRLRGVLCYDYLCIES